MAKNTITMESKGTSSDTNNIADSKPAVIKIAYIGGGSRGWAHNLMHDLAMCPYLNGEVALYDIDYPSAAFNAKFGNWVQTHPQAVSKWKC